jgi:FkbM family methyltransferase
MPGAPAVHAAILRHLEAPSVVTTTVSGLRLVVHAEGAIGRNLLLHGSYEPYETELLQSSITPGSTVIDIGANVGYYSLLSSRAVGRAGLVLSFEPHPQLFRLLSHNRDINGTENVVPFNVALSNRTGIAELFLSPVDPGKHSLSALNAAMDAGISPPMGAATAAAGPARTPPSAIVPVMRLDDFLRASNLPQVSVIKIDVEGAEALVLDGAPDMLAAGAPLTIFFEFWDEGISRLGGDSRALLSRLEKAGFDLSVIDSRNHRLAPATSDEILAQCQASTARQLNLHCARS